MSPSLKKIRQGSWLRQLRLCLYFNVSYVTASVGEERGREGERKKLPVSVNHRYFIFPSVLGNYSKLNRPSFTGGGCLLYCKWEGLHLVSSNDNPRPIDGNTHTHTGPYPAPARPTLKLQVYTASLNNIQNDKWHPKPGIHHQSFFKEHPSSITHVWIMWSQEPWDSFIPPLTSQGGWMIPVSSACSFFFFPLDY